MTGVFTASWAVALGAEPEALAVRISIGCPAAAMSAPFIGSLAPYGLFGKKLSPEQFEAGYRDRLDRYGVDGIRGRIEGEARRHPGRSLLLACFEKDPADCHRSLFAAWWLERTGEEIAEWVAQTNQLTLTEEQER